MKGVVITVIAANMMDLVPRADRDRHGNRGSEAGFSGPMGGSAPRPMTPSGEKRRDISPRKEGGSNRQGKARRAHEGHSSPHAFVEDNRNGGKKGGSHRVDRQVGFVPPMASDGPARGRAAAGGSSASSMDEDDDESDGLLRKRHEIRSPSPEPEPAAVPLHRLRRLMNSNGRRSRRKRESNTARAERPENLNGRIERAMSFPHQAGNDVAASLKGRARPERISLL